MRLRKLSSASILIASTIALVAILSGCAASTPAGGGSETPADAPVAEEATGPVAEEATVPVVLVEGFPSEVPLVDGTLVSSSVSVAEGYDDEYSANFSLRGGSSADLAALIETQFEEAGFVASARMDSTQDILLYFESANWVASAEIREVEGAWNISYKCAPFQSQDEMLD